MLLGEKAVHAIVKTNVPPHVLAAIDAAPKYAEGRGVRSHVRDARDLEGLETIAAIKLAT